MDVERRPQPLLWTALGCGCLAVVLMLCVGSGGALYYLQQQELGGPNFDLPRPEPDPVPMPPDLVPDPDPGDGVRRIQALVTAVQGLEGRVSVGDRCGFPVTREAREDGTFWCNAQVTCGDVLLYGGPRAGYFDCTLYDQPERHVVGEDPNLTSVDSDSALRINTVTGQLVARDDESGSLGAFRVEARIESVQ